MDDGQAVNRRVFLEVDGDHAGGGVYFDDAVGFGDHSKAVYVDQGLRLRGQLAKAVHYFFQQSVDLVGGFGSGQFFVEAQTQMHIAAVVAGQQRRCVQVDLGRHMQGA